MKKKEYVTPEVEKVAIKMECTILAGSDLTTIPGGNNDGDPDYD